MGCHSEVATIRRTIHHVGDFRSQFGPTYNLWRQQHAQGNVEYAQFFMRLCNYNRVNFTTYRRGNNLQFSHCTPAWLVRQYIGV